MSGVLRTADLASAWAIVAFAASVTVIYTLRAWRVGRATYARVDAQGSSALVGKTAMEMIYWSLQSAGRGLARTGLTPNQISALSLLAGAGAGVALAFGAFGVAALCTVLSGFLDLLDGMVARATGVASDAGEVVDAVIDRYTEYFFFGGLIVYYRALPVMMIVTMLAMVGSSLVTYSSAKAEALGITVPSAMMRRHERTAYLAAGACLAAFSTATFERTWSVPLGVPLVAALVIIAVLANVAAIRRFAYVARAATEKQKG